MSKTIRLIKDGHEIHMPEDWPTLDQVKDEGYVVIEEEVSEPEIERTTLDLKAQVPPKTPVDTTDTRTTLEKAAEKKAI